MLGESGEEQALTTAIALAAASFVRAWYLIEELSQVHTYESVEGTIRCQCASCERAQTFLDQTRPRMAALEAILRGLPVSS